MKAIFKQVCFITFCVIMTMIKVSVRACVCACMRNVGQQLVGDEGQRLAGVVGQLSVWQGSDQVWPVSESQPGLLHVFRHTFITVIQIIYVYLINNFTMFNNIINYKFDMIVSFVFRTYWKVPCPKNLKKLNSLTMFDLCTVCSSRFIDSCITGCF